jgi:hypothetical protein
VSVFGMIKTGWDVEKQVIDHLEEWMTTYLAEVERQQEIDPQSLPPVRSWITSNEFRKMPEEQTPVGVVVSPGITDDPVKDGEGSYRAKWMVGIAIVIKGRTKTEVAEVAKLYAAAVRGAMLQHRSLGGFARGVEWKDESYSDVPSKDQRTLGSAQCIFEIEVPDTINVFAGLVAKPDDPYEDPGDWPEVEDASVTVEKEDE